MKKILYFFAAILLSACNSYQTVDITLPDGFVVHALVAITPEQKEKGLMFITDLPENKGMLFVFEQEEPQLFWMKNTLIDLDMLFIGADKTITQVAAEVPHSYTYTPDSEVARVGGYGKYVLELSSKTAAKHGVKEGLPLLFDYETD